MLAAWFRYSLWRTVVVVVDEAGGAGSVVVVCWVVVRVTRSELPHPVSRRALETRVTAVSSRHMDIVSGMECLRCKMRLRVSSIWMVRLARRHDQAVIATIDTPARQYLVK